MFVKPKPEAILFEGLCRYALGLPGDLAMTWWVGLTSSKDRQVTYISRRLLRYRGRPESFTRYLAYITHTIPSTALVRAVETLCEEGRLTRQQSTAIEEQLFALMTQGYWAVTSSNSLETTHGDD